MSKLFTIHINKKIERQYGKSIRNYLFSSTLNELNFQPPQITQLSINLRYDFGKNNYPVSKHRIPDNGNCTTRIRNLFENDPFLKKAETIHVHYKFKKISSMLGDYSAPPNFSHKHYYNYAQTATAATYLITLANQNLRATQKKLNNLADNCLHLLDSSYWITNAFLCMFAIVIEYFRGNLCCGNDINFNNSVLDWFDYLEILEFRILPHACSEALTKFQEDTYKLGNLCEQISTKNNDFAKDIYQALAKGLSESNYSSPLGSHRYHVRFPNIRNGILNPTATMALWNLRMELFPKGVITDTYTEESDYNHPMDEEIYKRIVQRYRTILDKKSLSPKDFIQKTTAIIKLRKNYIPSVSGSSANGVVQCAFRTTEEIDKLFVDFCSTSLNTVIKLLENETGTDYYDVIQLYYLIKNEVENICLDDTPSKPLYTKRLADIEDNYLQFIRTKLIQVLEERNIPDTRAFILDLSLFDTVNSLELAETLLSCDPAKIENDLLVDCFQFICHSSTKASTESYCSISNQVCCIAFTSSGSLPKAPLSRITSFRNYDDLDETEHEIIKIYANMIYNDLTDIHRQIADIFRNHPI